MDMFSVSNVWTGIVCADLYYWHHVQNLFHVYYVNVILLWTQMSHAEWQYVTHVHNDCCIMICFWCVNNVKWNLYFWKPIFAQKHLHTIQLSFHKTGFERASQQQLC